MNIPLTLERTVGAPPEDVVRALRDAGFWKESAVPAPIRDQGLIAVELLVDRTTFRLQYYQATEGTSPPRLEGELHPDPRGTRIRIRIERGPGTRMQRALMGAGIALLLYGLFARSGGIPLLVVVFGGIIWMESRVLGAAGEQQARHLLARLDEALAPLPKAAKEARAS